jgi:hypothetical protein
MCFSAFEINELQAVLAQQKTAHPQPFDYKQCF